MEFGSLSFRLEMEDSKEEKNQDDLPGPSATTPKGWRYSASQGKTPLLVALGC